MKTVEIIVSPAGQTTVQTKGFSGASCQDATRLLEQALGTRIAEERTPEFYQAEDARQNVRDRA